MDVNQVKFGTYSIGTSFNGAQKKENKEASEAQVNVGQNQHKEMDVEGMYNAMDIKGAYNKAQINKTENIPNPSDYLSEKQISDIYAMMAGFDSGVNTVANTIEEEFPGVFADDQKFALAAHIFAQG